MQTLKDILGRQEERLNVKNGVICMVIVFILVTLVFGIRELDFFQKGLDQEQRQESGSTEAQRNP